MNNIETMILIIVIIFTGYFFFEVKKLKKENEELESFKRDLIRVTGGDLNKAQKNIAKFLMTMDKHNYENICLKIMSAEQVSKIDKPAFIKKQKKELEDLFKEKDSHDISFPALK